MKKLTESLEKYLLAIFELSKTNNKIMVKDVAKYLNLGGPSTSEAIKTLKENGFVNYEAYKPVSLTKKGLEAIEIKNYRHRIISEFLNQVLNIDETQSEINASKIEYSMTEDVLSNFVHFLDFMKQCSCQEPKWIKNCKHSLKDGLSEKCQSCISEKKGGCSSCCKDSCSGECH